MKKITAIILVLLLLTAWSVTAAAESNTAFMQSYTADVGTLTVSVAAFLTEVPKTDSISAKMGNENLPVLSVETVRTKERPVTYYVLADLSDSSSYSGELPAIREVLNTLADGKEKQDNVIFMPMGQKLQAPVMMNSAEEIKNAAKEIQKISGSLPIYDNIAEALTFLRTDETVASQKCLIVISAGADGGYANKAKDSTSSRPYDEVLRLVAETRVPVYTISTIPSGIPACKEAADLLGGIARESAGGHHVVLLEEHVAAKDAAQGVLFAMQSAWQITLDTSAVVTTETMPLSMTVRDGTAAYTDSRNFECTDLIPAPTEPETESESAEDQTETVSESTETTEPNPVSPVVLGGAAGAAVLVLAALLMISRRNKKKKNPENPEPQTQTPAVVSEVPTGTDTSEATVIQEIGGPDSINPEFFAKVTFTAIGAQNLRFELKFPKDTKVSVGRNSKADLVLNPQDTKLSSVHIYAVLEGDVLRITDAGSRNGTFVNGIPVTGIAGVALRSGDTIRIGSFEYRINIEQ